MEIFEIISQFRNKLSKEEIFHFMYNMKMNLEMNTNIFTIEKLYNAICEVYTDYSPLYQNAYYSPDLRNNMNILESNDIKYVTDQINKHFEIQETIEMCKKIILVHDTIYDDNNFFHSVIKIDSHSTYTELINTLDKIFEQAHNNENFTYVVLLENIILSKHESTTLFSNKIIPHNVRLPIKYVSKIYINDYFFNDELKQYYKIDKKNQTMIIVDINKQLISKETLNVAMINRDAAIISSDIYIHELNKLIKMIHK